MIRRVLSLPSGKVAVVILSLIALLAIFGSALAPQSPLANNPALLGHISGKHWLGTDYLGRDGVVAGVSDSTKMMMEIFTASKGGAPTSGISSKRTHPFRTAKRRS